MTYIAIIAICLASVGARDCNRHTAVDWIVAPEQQHGLAACMLHGQQYVSQSHLSKPGEIVKVFCRPGQTPPDNQG